MKQIKYILSYSKPDIIDTRAANAEKQIIFSKLIIFPWNSINQLTLCRSL